MRSLLMSAVLALGAFGFSMVTPTQARADDFRSAAAMTSATTVPAHWHHGYWGGRAFYPGWGYGGFYRGYYPGFYRGYYPYGGVYRNYYYGGGFYPYGYRVYGYGGWPYGGYYWW
jgi:hypothetical protein